MGRKPKVSFDQKLSAVKDYLGGKKNQKRLARENNVGKKTIQRWTANYQSLGEERLVTTSRNARYSSKRKTAPFEEYLFGQVSLLEI